MAHVFANAVLETSTTTGTGALTLAGAVTGYRTFASKCAVNDTVHYRIEEVDSTGAPTGAYELGRGTYSAASTLTRTTVIESSNANAAVVFANPLRVSITVLSPSTSQQVMLDWLNALATFGAAGAMILNDQTSTFEIKNNGGTGDSNLAMLKFTAVGNYSIKIGLRADGYIGIGGASRAAWSWYSDPSGNMVAAGNVTGFSDERVKTNWRPLKDDFVRKLASIKKYGVYDRTDIELTQVGVGAQSLRRLMPYAVIRGIDGRWTVNYGGAALVATIELAKDNESLRKELKAERKAREALERRLARIEKALTSTAKVKKK